MQLDVNHSLAVAVAEKFVFDDIFDALLNQFVLEQRADFCEGRRRVGSNSYAMISL